MEARLTGVVSEVAADEVTPELVRGVHDGEAAGCRIDDKAAGLCNGGDQPSDETNWFDVRAVLPRWTTPLSAFDSWLNFFGPKITTLIEFSEAKNSGVGSDISSISIIALSIPPSRSSQIPSSLIAEAIFSFRDRRSSIIRSSSISELPGLLTSRRS